MSTRHKRTQDLNILSAYLDHTLRETEKKHLETRLAQEPELRERLENLRRTKQMIGFLPRLKAPRNFTLTPEMVTVRKPRQPLFVTLRFATAVATFLLVALFGFERITSLPMMAKEAPLAMQEAERTFDMAETPEPLIIWGNADQIANGIGGGISAGGGGDPGSYVTEELTYESSPKTEEEASAVVAPEEPAEESAVFEVPPEAIEESTGADHTSNKTGDDEIILGLNTEDGGEVIERAIQTDDLTDEPVNKISVIRWAEIGLAVIALGGGISLWILRKKS